MDHATPSGPVSAFNRGLAERAGDVVIVDDDCVVAAGWLAELASVAHSEPRTACAFPLMNGVGIGFVPSSGLAMASSTSAAAIVTAACAGLPSWTIASNVAGTCVYLRGDVVDAVGLLEVRRESLDLSLRDWVTRAAVLGFGVKRANHAYVHRTNPGQVARLGPSVFSDARSTSALPFPVAESQLESFDRSLDGRLAAHAVRVQSTGKLRVAFDIRHLPREQVGTRTYAVGLGRGLAELPEIDLTLLVRDPAQAAGLKGRVVTEDLWNDDVELIHKPAQVIVPAELKLLFESSAHVVITYQDLIGYQIPSVFPTDFQHDRYMGTSSLSMQAVQRVVAYSESAGHEITAAFGIPPEEIGVVGLGVDAGWFAHRADGDGETLRKLGVPARYFFSIATDFPHKNLPNLLDSYASCAGGGATMKRRPWSSPATPRVRGRIFMRRWSRKRCPTA